MNKLKYILLYLVFIFFVGCKPSKSVIEKVSETKSDTLYNKVETVVNPPILSSLVINELCDSITGKPKEFKNRVIIDKDTVYVEVVDNELNITVNRLKNIISKKDSTYKAELLKIRNSKETNKVKEVWNKWTWVFLFIMLLCFFFPIIPKFINGLFRKLIGLI